MILVGLVATAWAQDSAPAEAPPLVPGEAPPVVVATPLVVLPRTLPTLSLVDDDDGWSVHDEAGRRYNTVQFARLVGDRAMLRRLEDREGMARVGQAGIAIAGGGALLAGVIVAFSNGGAPSVFDYSVDPTDYETAEDYDAAREFEREQYDKAVDAWEAQKLGSAAFLLGVGGVFLATAPFVGRDAFEAAERPSRAYERAEAELIVTQFNAPPAAPASVPFEPAPVPVEPTPAPVEPAPVPREPVLPPPTGASLELQLSPGFLALHGTF